MHTYVIENSTNYPLHRKRSQACHIGFTRKYSFLNVEAWISLKSIQNSDEQAYPREKKTVDLGKLGSLWITNVLPCNYGDRNFCAC